MKRIPQLDVLRGIAVLAVMLFHAGHELAGLHIEKITRFGWAGVDLFFVLSGFLITGILLRSRGQTGYFRGFYTRRALRIWPLYYLILLLTFAALPLAASHPWPSYLFFIQNWWMNPQNVGAGPVAVTWSLAIEEQFYIVWPLLVAFLPYEWLLGIAAAVFSSQPLLRFANLHWHLGFDPYRHTLFHLDGIALGCLIALWGKVDKSLAMFGVFLGIAGWALAPDYLLYTSVSILMASVLVLALSWQWMNQRFLAYVGTVSYCLYLVHIPVFGIIKHLVHHHSLVIDGSALLVGFGACFIIAGLSWKFIERPILSLKSHTRARAAAA